MMAVDGSDSEWFVDVLQSEANETGKNCYFSNVFNIYMHVN